MFAVTLMNSKFCDTIVQDSLKAYSFHRGLNEHYGQRFDHYGVSFSAFSSNHFDTKFLEKNMNEIALFGRKFDPLLELGIINHVDQKANGKYPKSI